MSATGSPIDAARPSALPSRARPAREARRTLAGAGIVHALHDGYTDLIYVLLPVWQAQFGLDYVGLALLRSLCSGALAALQMPSSRLGRRFGMRTVLLLGTLVSAGGYALAGASAGVPVLCLALLVVGAGSSTQHPLASTLVTRAYGGVARGPLGTYNFTGDLGKAAIPTLVGFLLALTGWRVALWLMAGLGVIVVLGARALLPRDPAPGGGADDAGAAAPRAGRAEAGRAGFSLLVAIGMLDNAARPAFLLFLPFLLHEKGAAAATVGVALSLVFVGGALGKAVCGRLGTVLGVTGTVLITETGTAAAILAAIALPLVPTLVLLPLLGVMLNGTSSVLYGTVPELAPHGRIERAFAIFYTCTLGGSALAAPLLYGQLGDAAGPHWAAAAAALTALAVVPLMLALAPHLRARAPTG